MTAIRKAILLCDCCPNGTYDQGWLTVRTARQYARKVGWRRSLRRDVCPAHLKGSR